MQTIIDCGRGYANSSTFSLMSMNVMPWMTAKASKTDYIADGAYMDRESSNGKIMGIFESAQSSLLFRDIYDVNICIDDLSLFIGKYKNSKSDATLTMFASEKVLQKDWDSPEENAAWANL